MGYREISIPFDDPEEEEEVVYVHGPPWPAWAFSGAPGVEPATAPAAPAPPPGPRERPNPFIRVALARPDLTTAERRTLRAGGPEALALVEDIRRGRRPRRKLPSCSPPPSPSPKRRALRRRVEALEAPAPTAESVERLIAARGVLPVLAEVLRRAPPAEAVAILARMDG